MNSWFFVSVVLPAIVAAIGYLAVLLHERELRKHRIKPGE